MPNPSARALARILKRPGKTPPNPEIPAEKAPSRASAAPILWLGYGALALLILGFGSWASLTNIAGAVIVSGTVETEQNRQVVQHPDGGVVAEILVGNGDKVEAGAPLLRLAGTELRSERAIVENQYYDLLARRGRLQAERSGRSRVTFPAELTDASRDRPALNKLMLSQVTLFNARRATLRNMLEQIDRRAEQSQERLRGIAAQSKALKEQHVLAGHELSAQLVLQAKGLAQSVRVFALRREIAALEGQMGELDARAAEVSERLSELEIEHLNLLAQRREAAEEELRHLDPSELDLLERLRALNAQIDRLELTAPTSGIVHAMSVSTLHSVIRPADALLYLIPQDRPMVISARIPTIHVDEVSAGQGATLHFSAFAGRDNPELQGVVTQISPDILVDPVTQTPYYRAEVIPAPGEMDKLGKRNLLPGMPVEVFLRTRDRTPLAYLLAPLSSYFKHAFRES